MYPIVCYFLILTMWVFTDQPYILWNSITLRFKKIFRELRVPFSNPCWRLTFYCRTVVEVFTIKPFLTLSFENVYFLCSLLTTSRILLPDLITWDFTFQSQWDFSSSSSSSCEDTRPESGISYFKGKQSNQTVDPLVPTKSLKGGHINGNYRGLGLLS